MYLMYKLPFVECLMFGALISATDPVTVLSIFQVLLLSLLLSVLSLSAIYDDATRGYK